MGGVPPPGNVEPIYDYAHGGGSTEGFSVTGGYVYRGPSPELRGLYFFGDYVSDNVWSLRYDGVNVTEFTRWTDELVPDAGSIGNIASFGEDAQGNLYIVDLGGEVFQLQGVSQQRALVFNLPGMDGDAVDDALVRNGAQLSYLEADSSVTFVSGLDPSWVVRGVGELNGNSEDEVLVRNGNVLSYLEADGSVIFIGGLDSTWGVRGVGDLDGDSAAEVLVRNGNLLSYLEVDGSVTFIGGLQPSWTVQAVGDLDGDQAEEVLLRNENLLSFLEADNSVNFFGGLDPAWVIQPE